MTTFVVDTTSVNFSFDGTGKWNFYSTWNAFGMGPAFLQLLRPGTEDHIITFYGQGLNSDADGFTAGTITGLTVFEPGYTVYMSGANVSAENLATLMKDSVDPTVSSEKSAEIFSLFFAGDDDITMGSGKDRIASFGGNDVLRGRSGDDTLIGGAGADALDGGDGSDTASYEDATAAIVANLANSSANTGEAAGDTYTSIENLTGTAFADTLTGDGVANRLLGEAGKDAISGGAGNDKLYGGADNDGIYGNDGNDYIVGGAGNDRLGGGAGSDTFVLDTAFSSRTNIDIITDFANNKSQNDVIWLDNAIFTNFGQTGAVSAANFVSNASGTAADGNDYLVYNSSNGNLYYDPDGNGATSATLFAQLSNKAAISFQDFIIV